MKKLVFLAGPAGIGKSTQAKHYTETHPEESCHIVSADETRKRMYGSYLNFPPNKNMVLVYEEMWKEANGYLQNETGDVTVIFDTTMLINKWRNLFLDMVKGYDRAELYLLKLHDWSLCLKRNKMRPEVKWVPEEVILSMIANYEEPDEKTKNRFDLIETVYLD